jgi:hypothetical protein
MKTPLGTLVLLVVGISCAFAQPPVNGLVAYFPLNGNANDATGNGHNGTVIGATLTEDRFGHANAAYSFDGDDYIKASATNLPTGERTTSLWFKANTVTTRPILLGYGGKSCPGYSWWMNVNHGGTAAFFLGIHCTESKYLQSRYLQVPTDRWVSFIATTDSTGCKIYIDGKKESSNALFINDTEVTDKDLSIGVGVGGDGLAPFTDGNVGYFSGVIDEVRIYDRSLSAEEVRSLYDEVQTFIKPSLAGHPLVYQLEQCYPNPFNPSTMIRYGLPTREHVALTVFNTLGQQISVLQNGEQDAGYHEVRFDGSHLPSGVYVYRMQAGSFTEAKKLLLVR